MPEVHVSSYPARDTQYRCMPEVDVHSDPARDMIRGNLRDRSSGSTTRMLCNCAPGSVVRWSHIVAQSAITLYDSLGSLNDV